MELLQENKVYLYAEYKINEEIKCQVIPSGNISDIIYEDGMTNVCFKNIIKRDGVFIDCTKNNLDYYSIGTLVTCKEVRTMIESNDPQLDEDDDTKKEIMEFTKYIDPNTKFFINPKKKFYINPSSKAIMPKLDGNPIYIDKTQIIKGDNCWYIELHNDDDVKYERTFLGDKKYRGQECIKYYFVLMCEYQINGEKRNIVIHREETEHQKSDYNHSDLDSTIDKAKELIIGSEYKFEGFGGVTPLYRYNTEDSSCVFHDNKSLIEGQNTVTVTGSGDAVLDLFMNGANKIVSFDINKMAKFWAELKLIAVKHLNYHEYRTLIATFDFDIYSKINHYLTPNTKKVWDELFDFCSLRGIKMDGKQSNLIYENNLFFTANKSVENPNGYCNEDNYLRLQEILRDKSIDDVSFITCDIYDLPKEVDLSEYSYAYLSNIMDFLVGIDKYDVNEIAVERFKEYVLKSLKPSMKENSNIDLCYISDDWHFDISKRIYSNIFSKDEGFFTIPLSNPNCKAKRLLYSPLLRENLRSHGKENDSRE